MSEQLPTNVAQRLFVEGATAHSFDDRKVPESVLRELYELAILGPTSMNCQPMRLVFIASQEGKELLRPSLAPGNVEKTMTAPVTVIVAFDNRFFDQMPTLFPFVPTAKDMFAVNASLARDTAFRNSSMQGAYLILAARSLGLAAGPMSGFDANVVNQAFFPYENWQANFLVNLGYPSSKSYRPRGPKLSFDIACRMK